MLRSWRKLLAAGVCVATFGLLGQACVTGDDPGGTLPPGDAGKTDSKVTDTGMEAEPPIDTGTAKDTKPVDESGCTPPAGKKCGVFPQCGCAPEEKCDITKPDGSTECSASGTLGLSQRCDKGSCMKGFACVGALCRPYCGTDTDCKGSASGVCHSVTTGGTTPTDIPGFKTCFVACDPSNPSKACALSGCSFLDSTTTTCAAAGTGKGAGACGSTDPNACAPGYVCLSTGDCRQWCRMTGSDCGTGTCGKLTLADGSSPTYLGTEYGVCP
jgi:hypothetical protein